MRSNNENTQLNIWQRIRLEMLWGACRFVAAMPYWFQYYVLQEIVCLFLRMLRYRYDCITDNLRRSFPEKSGREIAVIRCRFYSNLAEMIVNTLVQARMSDGECRRRMVFTNCDETAAIVGDGTAIGLTSHLGCWEYYGFWGMWLPNHILVAVYHRIHNPVVDELFKRLRDHTNELPVQSHDSLRFFMRYRNGYEGKALFLGLISDQNPPRYADSHWFDFLNRDTLFFEGGEQLALKYGLPLFYASQRKVRRGYYEARFDLIYDGREQGVDVHDLTERYVRRLEHDIREHPEMWMWSHYRWKHQPTEGDIHPIERPRGY